MYCLMSIVLGYSLSIIAGDFVISKIVRHCWDLLEKDWNSLSEKEREEKSFRKQTKNKERIKRLQGAAEIALYITAIVFFKHPEWIGAWLTVKLAVSWQSFNQDKIYSSHNIFLLGTSLTIIFALIGTGLIIKFPLYVYSLVDIYHWIMTKISWDLIALICTIPTAFLAFKSRFIENFETQCLDLLKKENRGVENFFQQWKTTDKP